MKYYKRLKVYKASNVIFDPQSMTAYSYRWWKFLEVVGDMLIFNDYSYSPSTRKHQNKVLAVLRENNVKIDMFIKAPKGLQNIESTIDYYKFKIILLEREIEKPRSHKRKNEERLSTIEYYKEKINEAEFLIKKKGEVNEYRSYLA